MPADRLGPTRNLRDIYGDTNVVCSDLRPLKGDPYEHEHLDKCIEAFKKVRAEIEK